MQGVSGENLLRLMELRMDNVVYRLGFATSRPQARQLVVHGHFQLNGRKHNIPSAILKPGDVINVREKSRDLEPIQNAVENVVAVPPWLEADHDNFTGRLLHTPGRDEIDAPVEEQLIIEFYSR
jgi:small subunit ribosomal protein S4